MFCSNCGARISPSPGLSPTRCAACGQFTAPAAPTPEQAQQQAAARALLEDRNGDGIPDLLEDRNRNGIPDALEGPMGMAPMGMAPMGMARPSAALDIDHVPPAPRTASPAARDLVFRYQGSQNVKMWVGCAFLIMGTVMSTIFCWGIPSDLAIALFGAGAQGTVTGTEIQTSVSVNRRHPQLVNYSFRYQGATYTGSSSTLSYTPGLPKAGTPIAIELLPFSPSISRAAGTTSSFFGYGTLFVLLFPLIGGALTFFTVRENRREIHAFIHGKPALARVTFEGLDHSTKSNGRHPYKIEWQLQVGPSVYTGSISHMNRSAISGLPSGGQIIVLYDPHHPSINTVYVA
jgi:hypothetical protein